MANSLRANAIFTGTQKGLTIVGDLCYAYSGAVSFDENETTLLEFNTGKNTVRVHVMPYREDTDSLDSKHRLYLNNILVWGTAMSSGGSLAQEYNRVILPPLSLVKITIQNVSNTSGGSGGVALSGGIK